MGVLLQAAYRGPTGSVPTPADGHPGVPCWWDRLAAAAHDLRTSGFTAVLLPPVLKTSAGAAPHTDGYTVPYQCNGGNDFVKGLAVQFVDHWLITKSMATRLAVGEYFDGDPRTLHSWVWDSGMKGRCAAFDFSLRFALAAMCANPSNWDMRQLDHAGLTGISPQQSVTFIENPDTDGSSPVVTNKLLAYAYLLTAEGYSCTLAVTYTSTQHLGDP